MNWARRSAPSRWWRASWSGRCRKIPPKSRMCGCCAQQAERCRAIIARLANPEEAMLGATARLPLGALLDDIASALSRRGCGDPHR